VTTTTDIGSEVEAAVRISGGATLSTVPGVSSPRAGYIVSLPGHECILHYPSTDVSKAVREFSLANKAVLAQPGKYLGAWVDKDLLYLDVSQHVAELGTAYELGQRYHQLAIYDVSAGKDIRLENVQPFDVAA
jgi:hypothetical protein